MILGEGPQPARVLVLGEAPGQEEERRRRPFVGKAGKELDRGLAIAGLDRGEVFITNVMKTRPRNNKAPSAEEIAYWRPAVLEEIQQTQPEVIIAAGSTAAAWFGFTQPMEALHGIPREVALARVRLVPDGAWVDVRASLHSRPSLCCIPVYHPAAPLHDSDLNTAYQRDWGNVRRFLDGTLAPWTPCPPPVVTLATSEDLDRLDAEAPPTVAVDTEGSMEAPWGLSFAWSPTRAWVLLAGDPLIPRLHAALQSRVCLLHYALHDLPVLARLGVRPAAVRDTLRLARAIGETGGLKPLAYRLLRRELREYSDVVAPYRAEHFRNAALAAADALPLVPKPDRAGWPRTREGGQGYRASLALWKSSQKPVQKLLRAFLDVAGSPDPAGAWKRRVYLPPAPPWTPPPDGPFLQYAGEDAAATIGLLPTLDRLTVSQREYEDLDRAVLPMIERMQEVGLPVDRSYLDDLGPVFTQLREDLRREMQALAGLDDSFNPDSGPQVKHVLFEVLGLHPWRFSKQTGEPSADEKFLTPLQSSVPFVDLLLQYRELGKLDGTYRASWLAFLQPDGRLRPRLDIGAKTGRLTARDPNVLAIPKHSAWGKLFRNAIRTAVPGRVILAMDLSQIELRELADQSQDAAMCAAFRAGRDIHSETASRIWRIPIERLDEARHRLPAKTTNFGIVMGITGKGLSEQMGKFGITGWSEDTCTILIADWLKAFPGVATYMERRKAEALEHGYVTGRGGKVFWLAGVWSSDRRVREEAERQSHALPIQYGAQYLIKRAMARFWHDELPALRAKGYIECLLQIHDELVFELDEALVPEAAEVIHRVMTTTTPLSIPVEADGKVGPVWAGKDWRKL